MAIVSGRLVGARSAFLRSLTTARQQLQRKPMSRQAEVSQRIAKCRSLEEVEGFLRRPDMPLESFDLITTCTALHRLARYSSTSQNLLQRTVDRMTDLLTERASSVHPRVVSNALWSSARLWCHTDCHHLVRALVTVISSLPSLEAFEPLHIANCLWACGSLYEYLSDAPTKRSVLAAASPLVDCLMSRRPSVGFTEQNISNIIWGLGVMEVLQPSGLLLLHLSTLAEAHLNHHAAATQSQANAVWGLAKLLQAVEDGGALSDIEKQQVRRVIQNVSFRSVTRWSSSPGVSARPEELGMVVWALAVALGGVTDASRETLAQLSSVLRSNAASIAALRGSDRLVSNILWSFGTLRYWDDNLQHFLDTVSPVLSSPLQSSARNACASVWALAVLDLPLPSGLLEAAVDRCLAGDPEPRAITALLIGVAASIKRPILSSRSIESLFRVAESVIDAEHLPPALAAQLFTVQLWGHCCLPRPLYWSERLLQKTVECGVKGLPSDTRIVSGMQSAVREALERASPLSRVLVEPTAVRAGWDVDFGIGGELGFDWMIT
ncbi:hypothetical protein FOZ62_000167 [Perkinsus olseni]|uniref:Uncharacterized protein n=1 Tax=Perkinsus olseni TaxID=32597 RepID=A0A7J6Q8H4_PEROL|nr:hypothetical protein FOZ62_000167 [Perkinsus olseni]